MAQYWQSTSIGRLFTRSRQWTFELEGTAYVLQIGTRKISGPLHELSQVALVPGMIWASLSLTMPDGELIWLSGIRNTRATAMLAAITGVRKAWLVRELDEALPRIVMWTELARNEYIAKLKNRGWLTHEFQAKLEQTKPSYAGLFGEPETVAHLATQPETVRGAVKEWRTPCDAVARAVNERQVIRELNNARMFFPASPLTEEQAKAVLCFDNRVLLVASAGSGKTLTMVAKAGYALQRGYFTPDQILLLAFNTAAAVELRERVAKRLLPMGLNAEKIVIKTFHAFGVDVIGEAEGRRPTVAPWLKGDQDVHTLLEIVDELKDRDSMFRTHWDLFRVVLGHDLPRFGTESSHRDVAKEGDAREGFWTLNNENVKSRGEQLIANWFFYNGVEYVYEASYKYLTADAKHKQYQPDFYLPAIDAYLEHWALDERGEPPAEFIGYKAGMDWKRALHARNGTTLLETTTAALWSGEALRYLGEELTARGLALDPNPDRPAPGRKPIENPRLARTFRAFLVHAKSNMLSRDQLEHRLLHDAAGPFRYRHQVFLALFDPIRKAWDAKLRSEGVIDFEDMLNMASNHVETGKWLNPFKLVMVDEFQDTSRARARLVAGLIAGPDQCLFAVGDDWQSINRYAGADLSVMTEFQKIFGSAVTLKLEQTFRCPQSLCHISGFFAQKNPKQLRKTVRATRSDVGYPVTILRVDDAAAIRNAVSERVKELAATVTPGREKLLVYVLGRYNSDKVYLPEASDRAGVTLRFVTAHSSKGLEADHIIVPKVTSEMLGFPSRVADDPVLQLAMPGNDSFPYAEERRLFYVALTRAKQTVTLVTVLGNESAFIAELVQDHQLPIVDVATVQRRTEMRCPDCALGTLIERTGKYGKFEGCSRFPKCRHTAKYKRPNR